MIRILTLLVAITFMMVSKSLQGQTIVTTTPNDEKVELSLYNEQKILTNIFK